VTAAANVAAVSSKATANSRRSLGALAVAGVLLSAAMSVPQRHAVLAIVRAADQRAGGGIHKDRLAASHGRARRGQWIVAAGFELGDNVGAHLGLEPHAARPVVTEA